MLELGSIICIFLFYLIPRLILILIVTLLLDFMLIISFVHYDNLYFDIGHLL